MLGNKKQYMAIRPHIRVSCSCRAHHGLAWAGMGKPMPSSWELHLLHVSGLCPCAVNLGTAEFLSDRGRWGRWIRRRRMRAQPRPPTAHSPQYSTVLRVLISHHYYLCVFFSEGSLLIFLATAFFFLHQDQEEPSVAAPVPCQPLQSVGRSL